MKKILLIAFLLLSAVGSVNAQYYLIIDPFSPADFKIKQNENGPYNGYTATTVNRSLMSPSINLNYKRVLEFNNVNASNIILLGYTIYRGTVEGVSNSNPDNTFITNYSRGVVEFSDFYSLDIPIGDVFSINAGLGTTVGFVRQPKAITEYSDGSPTHEAAQSELFSFGDFYEDELELNIWDFFKYTLDYIVGVNYNITDDITLSFNLHGTAINIISELESLFSEETSAVKNYEHFGDGLYVSKKLPCRLLFGFTYAM